MFGSIGTSYAIPVFAFLSGFGQKNFNNLGYFGKILSVYIIANLLYVAADFVYIVCLHKYDNGTGDKPPMWFMLTGLNTIGLWYFLGLIIWRTVAPLAMRFRWPLLTSAVFSILLYGLSEMMIAPHSGTVGKFLANPVRFSIRTFPYYFAGVLASREQIMRLRTWKYRWLLILPSCAALYFFVDRFLVYDPIHNSIVQCTGYLVAASICSVTVVALMPGRQFKGFTRLGQKSLAIYLFHPIILKIFVRGMLLPVFARVALLQHSLIQVPIYLLVVYVVCVISAQDVLMNSFNIIAGGFERFLFRTPADAGG